jgi:hypothetical protein
MGNETHETNVERERREADLRAQVRIEVELEKVVDWSEKHEVKDDERFEKLNKKLDGVISTIGVISKNQTRMWAYGVAAFTVISFALQYFLK